jgi:superfamily I DNA/RNA helicase
MSIFDEVSTGAFAPHSSATLANGKPASDYQIAIFDATERGSENILVQAVAGSGKTTTLEEISRRTSATLLCFNKPIAEAAKARGINAKTLHSFGNSAVWKNARGARVDFEKLDRWLDKLFGAKSIQVKNGYMIKRVVAAIKNSGMGLTGELHSNEVAWAIEGWDSLDIPEDEIPMIAEASTRLWRASVLDTSCVDFDDMLYMPLFHQWNLQQRDTILVDESQDLNHIQHLLLQAMNTRIIAVGDRWQGIYAFRGALSDSMDRLKSQFKMIELPLSICYRCPQSVIREAQKLCPHIEWREGAPEGSVLSRKIEWDKAWKEAHEDWELSDERAPTAEDPKLFERDVLVLCRNNAPLFSAVMRHVRAQKPCRVLSNALEGLANFIKRFRADSTSELMNKIDNWLAKEIDKHFDAPWRVQSSQDKVATIKVLAEHFTRTEDLLRLIKTLSEGKDGPIFSTIHKAKGLEEKHVYFLRPDLCPSPWAKKKEEQEQERNLRYVAVTRTQESLTYGVTEL